MKIASIFLAACLFVFDSCTHKAEKTETDTSASKELQKKDSVRPINTVSVKIEIEKDLLYDKHTLADDYPYKDTIRQFQWEKIRERLRLLEAIQKESTQWAILQNYKNLNGEAPLVRTYRRNSYKRIADTLGIERYQGIPFYLPKDTLTPERYGQDGTLVRWIGATEGTKFAKIETVDNPSVWMVPNKYLKLLPDTVSFHKTIFVDRKNQNITTLQQDGDKWLVRSMNPATTGQHKPPYAQETPLGIFMIQEKKSKMIYLADGSKETGGFAPYASRFTNGGYIHGVPVNAPRTALIEYSPSLGTTPRSHMCVRNATSHAKFVYDWAPTNEAVVFVFD